MKIAIRLFTTLAFSVLVVLPLIAMRADNVSAIDDWGPDQADFFISQPAGYSSPIDHRFLTDTTGAQAWKSIVSVYFRDRNASVYIESAGLCSDGASVGDGPNPSSTTTTFTFEPYTPLNPLPGTIYDTQSITGCSSTNITLSGTIPNSGAAVVNIGGVTWYRAKVRAVMTTGLSAGNSFKVRANGGVPNSYVSFFNQSGNDFVIQDRAFNTWSSAQGWIPPERYSTYELEFGTECSVTSNTTATLQWYDDDWGDPSSTAYALQKNAPGSGHGLGWYRMQLFEYDRSNNLTDYWALAYDANGNLDVPAGDRFNSTTGFTGNQQPGSATFTAKPNRVYRWVWNDVRRTNAIQFQVPYDSIYALYDCDSWEYNIDNMVSSPAATGTWSGRPTVDVEQGQNVTLTTRARNPSSSTTTGDNYVSLFRPINDTHNDRATNDLNRVTGGSDSGHVYGGTYSTSMGYRWSNLGGLAPNTSRGRSATYQVDPNASVGNVICFYGRVAPAYPSGTVSPNRKDTPVAGHVCIRVIQGTEWDYEPRILSQTGYTPPGVVRPGDTIRIVADTDNVGDEPGPIHELDIYAQTNNGGHLWVNQGALGQNDSISGSWSSSTPTRAEWNNIPALSHTDSNGSANRWAEYIVDSATPSGTVICFRARVNPNSETVSGWDNTTQDNWCFTVDRDEYDHVPTISILDDTGTGESGVQIQRGDSFRTRATITNNDIGLEPYETESYANSGGSNISRNTSATTPSYSALLSNPGYRWDDNNGVANGSSETYTGGFSANIGANLGRDNVCFRSNVSPAQGEVGWSPPADVRDWSPEVCADIYDVFDHQIPGGTFSGVPGGTIQVAINNVGGGNGPISSYSVSGPGVVADSGTIPDPDGSSANGGGIPSLGTGLVDVTIDPNASIGTYCFTFVVTPGGGRVYNDTATDVYVTRANETASGSDICVRIVENPYLEVYGADVHAGGVFGDIANPFVCLSGGGDDARIESVNRAALDRGSFTEYGLFATGGIVDFGSHNSILETELTFANTPSLGDYSNTGKCITHYFGLFHDSNLPAPSGPVSGLDGQYLRTGQYTIGGNQTIGTGDQVIILVDGDVRINNNISYQSGYSAADPSQIPLFMIIATGDIEIHKNVQQLDGAYISVGGTIDTCFQAPAAWVIGDECDENQLVINGIFIAQSVDFNRSNGGLVRDGAAEVFNFSPELYLTLPDYTSAFFGDFNTEQFKDLPPVY